MNREEIGELAAAYALGTLDDEDRARFEALLQAGDAEAVRVLREFQAAVVGLAGELRETPPPSVKLALMDRITVERKPRVVPRAPAAPARRRFPWRAWRSPGARPWWTVVWAGAMAAGVAAIVVGLAVSTSYERRLAQLSQDAAILRQELERQQAVVAILRDPATQVVALDGQAPSPEARGRMLWHAAAGGLFVSAGLPPPPPGKAYQLWAIAGKNAPVSAGVFTVDAKGTGSVMVPPLPGVARVDVFAVTLEPAGGLPAPSGAMYLVGKS
jgi:anti-sigma-K factor RskA